MREKREEGRGKRREEREQAESPSGESPRGTPEVSSRFSFRFFSLPHALVLLVLLWGVGFRALRALEPAPFADSYHHWLVAARLVEVGGVAELFTQPDGAWPPLYSLFAAALLALFGTASMTPLVWGNILCAAATTYIVALLARPRSGEDAKLFRFAPPLAALFFALSPLDILTSSAPAMDPLAVLLLALHLLLTDQGRAGGKAFSLFPRSSSSLPPALSPLPALLAGLCLAAACLTRYEAWGYLALAAGISLFSRERRWKEWALWYGPGLFVCALWGLGAGLGALSEKLLPEAARHTGEAINFGAVAGRVLVASQTLLLAASPLLPAALVSLRRREPLCLAARLFGLLLIAALVLGIASGLIAGSHRYLELALPIYAVLAARFWLSPTRRAAYVAGAVPLLGFLLAAFASYGSRAYGWDLGFFWFYLQPLPLACLLGAALLAFFAGRFSVGFSGGVAAVGAAAVALALAISYLPILSHDELGKFAKPFRYAGEILRQEETGVVLLDNPIPGYFSGIAPRNLVMANRPRELSALLSRDLLARIGRGEAAPEEVVEELRRAGVTHIVSEEVPYLFTRRSLLPSLPEGSLLPLYWTRVIVFREIAVFRLLR